MEENLVSEAPAQTLSRGLRVLEVLAGAAAPLTVEQVALAVELHRSIAYRLVRTLEHHRLVERSADGRYQPSVGLAVLARSVLPNVRSAAEPLLERLAAELGLTAFVVVPWADDCVTLASVEPRGAGAQLAQRPGTVHRLDRGAPGTALLAAMPGEPVLRAEEVLRVRARGYALSHDEVILGLRSVAVPVLGTAASVCALAVVYIDGAPVDEADVAQHLSAAARDLATALGAR